MVIGFKKQFVEPILQGSKVHTIRWDSYNRWKPGNSIQMATGVRTKYYNCFKTGNCVSTQEIEINYRSGHPIVYVDGSLIYVKGCSDTMLEKMRNLAVNDGFDSIKAFFEWPEFSKAFLGKIIHWTDLRY